MIILKDGSETQDPRLDRLIQFDERSRNFPIRALNEEKKLRSYTWRCNEWLDQGREGACVAFSLGHELAARPAEIFGILPDYLVRDIYWEAQRNDPWPGGAYPGASPRYEGTSVLSGVQVLQQKGFFGSYRWGFGLRDTLLGLAYNGPSVLGIAWYEGMYNTDANGFVKPTGKVVGGHAILARAVNVEKEYITLRNSWGKGWGRNGDCYLSFTDLERLLKEDGESVFLLNRKAKGKSFEQIQPTN